MQSANFILHFRTLRSVLQKRRGQVWHSLSAHATYSAMEIDEILHLVGNLGRFQLALITLFCLMEFPNGLLIMSTYFTEENPAWQCATNSSMCNMNGTFSVGDSGYRSRCSMPRSAWEFVKPKEFSVVTQVGESYISFTTCIALDANIPSTEFTYRFYFLYVLLMDKLFGSHI